MDKAWQLPERSEPNLLKQILLNRGIAETLNAFIHPTLPDFKDAADRSGLSPEVLQTATTLIREAIRSNRPIIIHGDYDVDGTCAAAILWEVIYFGLKYKNTMPFIPNRFDHGYGISSTSLREVTTMADKPLLISVDCGITSVASIAQAKEAGLQVIIADHHIPAQTLPAADVIIHTTKLSGAGIAWILAETLAPYPNLLELVALGTIADVHPLTGINRQLVFHGLTALQHTPRFGLTALINISGCQNRKMTPGIVGWWLGPRLNAAGRLESAMDSLRLITTKNEAQAFTISKKLNDLNAARQNMTETALDQAKTQVIPDRLTQTVFDRTWNEGILGLIAGRLKEELYRPVLALTATDQVAKGSARSIDGFDVTQALRNNSQLLLEVGGHPLAAGFSLQTNNIEALREAFNQEAVNSLSAENLVDKIKIDAELLLSEITPALSKKLSLLEPYGVGNPEPIFLSRNCSVRNIQYFGRDKSHIKLTLEQDGAVREGIVYRFKGPTLPQGQIDCVYKTDTSLYQGLTQTRLILEDFHLI